MKRIQIILFCIAISIALPLHAKITLTHLTIEGRTNPMGLDETAPRFGWQIVSTSRNVVQQSYRVIVAASQSAIEGNIGDVWDSGIVASDSSQWVNYKGPTLKANRRYYWKVQATTNHGRSGWSKTAHWHTGLLTAEHWQGDWIGLDSLTDDVVKEQHARIAARYLRKSFNIKKPIKRAMAHICGLGYYTLSINAKRVGNYLLAPAPTQYDKVAAYDTYDVTDFLKTGNTTIDVVLGGGYFFAMAQNYQVNVRSTYGMPKMKMNLILEYADDTSEVIASDTSWQVAVDGPIRYANLYDGTLIDLRRTPTCWQPVQKVSAPCKEMRGVATGGVTCYAKDKATVLYEKDGTFLLDFGTNNAGRMALDNVKIARGDTLRIRYAEMLKENGKALYCDNLRSAENTDWFIGNGETVNLTTEFLWHGFRYIEVTGLSRADAARIVRENMTDEGILSASSMEIQEGDNMLNRILANARRGILDNYKGIPMDCPQRDERMPWLGDRTMGCYGESYVTYNHTLYSKWLRDICDSQRPDGAISDVSPSYWRLYNGNITWPAALPFGMEMLRLQYGDERPKQRMEDNVKRFLRFTKKNSFKEGLITYDRYGDWCVPPTSLHEVLTEDSTRLTDGVLLSSCYYQYICRMAGLDNEADSMCVAINKRFLKDGQYANGTVTANLLPLAMHIVPQAERTAVHENLIKRIMGKDNDPHIDCGVIGISWLLRYLAHTGNGELAYRIASTKTYPGWGYMVENGATTIWELWNGNTANPSMNSGNHVMLLGDFIPWLYECVAGIAPDAGKPGFKHIVMQPDFSIDRIQGATAQYPTMYGTVRSQWQRKGGKITWRVSIPANTTASLKMPDGTQKQVGSGDYIFHAHGK